jgi:urease accessory protein
MKTCLIKNGLVRWISWMLAMLMLPSLADAHIVAGQTSGFVHGLVHPFTGFDHIAAMVAVGLWAAQRGGRALWVVPLTFVGVMSVSGLLGMTGASIPFVEPGIAASVLVLGLLVAAAVRLPLVASSLIVGLFAVFHGYAHGTEMPETMSGLGYGVGFMLATGLLHCCGIGLGLLAGRLQSPRVVRYAGGATAALGVYLLVS